jgi:N-acetylmuramic acid 6-phosphate etherase
MDLADLTTEGRNPASEDIDRLSPLEIVQLMNAEDTLVPAAVRRVLEPIAQAATTIAERLRDGGRLIYLGAGTSGRLGVLDASECPPTFNARPWQVVGLIAGGPAALTRSIEGAEDLPQHGADDLRKIDLTGGDVVVGIATSGRTPYVVGGLQYAREIGASAIGLSCNEDSELAAVSDLMIVPVVGPEIISGSTRMKAGTATKLVLNMLTTCAMVQLGKTYGNLMVDLQTTNQKLTDRAQRIVAQLAGVTAEEARRLLQQCGGDTKTSIVSHRRSVPAEQAARMLAAAGGQLRVALEQKEALAAAATDASEGADRLSELVLSVDGGGTKTVAWIAEEQAAAPIGAGLAGASNPQAVGWRSAMDQVDLAVERAFGAAGLPRGPIRSVCLALAGAGRQQDRERVEQWARQRHLADHILVTHDAMPVLAAGTPNCTGIALISGTGSLAFGRDAVGTIARAGGWGHLMGDEGSGYAIARAALQAVARSWDGRGPVTMLGGDLAKSLGVSQPAQLLAAIYERQTERDWLASLARVVSVTAEQGDAAARGILEGAAQDLAELFCTVARELGFGTLAAPVPVALAGGMLTSSALLRDALRDDIAGAGFQDVEYRLVPEPVVGGIKLASGVLHS